MALEVELAWAAGIIDGEGCIMIAKIGPRQRMTHPHYRLVLKVAMGCQETISQLSRTFPIPGHHVRQAKMAKYDPRTSWNDVYIWEISARKAEIGLRQIRPYSITKRKEIDLALEFMETPTWNGGFQGNAEEYTQIRHSYYESMRMLKPRTRLRDYRAGLAKKPVSQGADHGA